MTVAKYYIPSGRCIQAIDYFDQNNNGRPDKIPDSLVSEFKTAGDRLVYDGGGIVPDIDVESRQFSQITGDLFAQNYIFNFANDFVLDHPTIVEPAEFKIDDITYGKFKSYVAGQDFDYLTETENLIERIRNSAEREGYLASVDPIIDSLEMGVRKDKLNDIENHRSEIEELIKFEIVSRYYYQKGKVIATLENDNDIERAIDILTDKALYQSILDGTYTDNEKQENE